MKLKIELLPAPWVTRTECIFILGALLLLGASVADLVAMQRRLESAKLRHAKAEQLVLASRAELKRAAAELERQPTSEESEVLAALSYPWATVFAAIPDVGKYPGTYLKSFRHARRERQSEIVVESESLNSILDLSQSVSDRTPGEWMLLDHTTMDAGGHAIEAKLQWSLHQPAVERSDWR
jgi:hypothetical protein